MNEANVVASRQQSHHCLRHPSNEVFTIFLKNLGIFSNVQGNNKVDVCDTFFRAKQTSSLFSNSESKASDLFDLIHYDI